MQKILCLGLVICVLFLVIGLMPVHGEADLYGNVLRLHVLANSDSEEDQALKLKVRDAVLEESRRILADAENREQAERLIRENLDQLKASAQSTVEKEGRADPVTAELGNEVYPTRSYEACCFPSGSYLSLRIRIGEGEGQNWWCVLFPPMCLSAASEQTAEDAFISVGLTDGQYRIITETDQPSYSVRFRLLEILEEALRK